MKTYQTAIPALAILVLAACGSAPTQAPAEQRAGPVERPDMNSAQATAVDTTTETDADESGLGTLASNGRGLMNCGRVKRTGSRIPRDVCGPNSFNGLYPSGVNMSTYKESGPRWGN